MYERFLERLKLIREYEWNRYDIKIQEEIESLGWLGVREGENALEAIARHMTEVYEEYHGQKDTEEEGPRERGPQEGAAPPNGDAQV